MTIFEKIIARELPAKIIWEDDDAIAFHDVNPQAPVHVLIVPKKVIPRLSVAGAADSAVLAKLLLVAGKLAKELGVTRRCLYKWRTKLEAVEPGEEAARPSTHALAHRKEILQLKRLLAEKAMEVDFLKGALQKVEARRQRSSGSGGKTSTNTSKN